MEVCGGDSNSVCLFFVGMLFVYYSGILLNASEVNPKSRTD